MNVATISVLVIFFFILPCDSLRHNKWILTQPSTQFLYNHVSRQIQSKVSCAVVCQVDHQCSAFQVVNGLCMMYTKDNSSSYSLWSGSDRLYITDHVFRCTARGYSYFPDGNMCIKWFTTKEETWTKARSVCQADGGELVKVSTVEQLDILRYAELTNGADMWHVGASDLDDGTWRWVVDGTPVDNFIWHTGEPNDATTEEGCALIHNLAYSSTSFMAFDIPCSWSANYICELFQY